VYLLAEMMRRMGFTREATRLLRVWQELYRPQGTHRIPPALMHSAPRLIPEVVDEIAFQTRRNLAQRALADILPFARADEDAIRDGAARLAAGRETALPPRHLVSAAHYALEGGRVAPQRLARTVVAELVARGQRHAAATPPHRSAETLALAA
jgi:hypothetical protein